jgi:3-hexulose-6-phosphate synthase
MVTHSLKTKLYLRYCILKNYKRRKKMKLHFTYNLPSLSQAIKLAKETVDFADILGIGSLLLLENGITAIKDFKKQFPNKDIFVESNIIEKTQEAITLMADSGASYISILAGTPNSSIKRGIETAKSLGVKIALNLIDSPSLGQSAMDAKMMGVNFLILNRIPGIKDTSEIESEFHDVRANSSLPIFITGSIDQKNLPSISALKPYGVMIGTAITKSSNPAQVAQGLQSLIKK